MRLQEVIVRPVCASEESRFKDLMRSHHYLGLLPKIGNTLWYEALWEGEWVSPNVIPAVFKPVLNEVEGACALLQGTGIPWDL